MTIDHSIEIDQQQKNEVRELMRAAVKDMQDMLDTVEKDLREHDRFTIGVVSGLSRAPIVLGEGLTLAETTYRGFFETE